VRRLVLGSLLAVCLSASTWAQRDQLQLVILSPTSDDVLFGVMTLQAEVRPWEGSVRLVTFFVDGVRACSASASPFRCQWDSASIRGVRDVRAVADLTDGTRLVQTVRTKGTVATFRGSADSVFVPVRVRDRSRKFVRGLGPESFKLFEDGVPQPIVTFSSETSGGDVLLALDGSSSMRNALPELRLAARALITALPKNDVVTLTAFNSAIKVMAPRGATPEAQLNALARLRAGGSTALYDVLIQAADLFPTSTERRAIVMFTDGDDVSSRTSLAAARLALQSSNVVLYFVGQGKAYSDHVLRDQLTALAVETGGAAYFAARMRDTRDHFAAIAEELSHQYVLAYLPIRPFGDGAWREIRVDPADASKTWDIIARRGYLAVKKPAS
jgi:VWFA-related protein